MGASFVGMLALVCVRKGGMYIRCCKIDNDELAQLRCLYHRPEIRFDVADYLKILDRIANYIRKHQRDVIFNSIVFSFWISVFVSLWNEKFYYRVFLYHVVLVVLYLLYRRLRPLK